MHRVTASGCEEEPVIALGRSLVAALTVAALALLPYPLHASEEVSSEEMNKSNNPLNPAPAFNLQDYWSPTLYDVDQSINDFLPRLSKTIPSGKFVHVPQILRLTVPISTRPNGATTETGLGDINLFDILLLRGKGGVQFGLGPLLSMPTASHQLLGTGKFQGGVAVVALKARPRGILAGLIQWQASFAGDGNRPEVSSLTFQPLLIHNLSRGYCLRSTAVWTFDLESGHYHIPVGLGVGKVKKAGTKTMNFVLEPQWTVAHDGAGLPRFTLFAAVNTQIGR